LLSFGHSGGKELLAAIFPSLARQNQEGKNILKDSSSASQNASNASNARGWRPEEWLVEDIQRPHTPFGVKSQDVSYKFKVDHGQLRAVEFKCSEGDGGDKEEPFFATRKKV